MRPTRWFKKLAVPLADKIVYASDAYIGLKSTINDMSSTLIDFSRPPAGPADDRLLEFAQLIRPWTHEGLELIRVGGDHDGGYIMANDFKVSGAVSIGVGRDVSWDKDIASRGIPVVMFDPTVRKPPERVEGTRFVRVGLGPSDSEGQYRTLMELMDLAGMSGERELLLKIDVEGAEWNVFSESVHDFSRYRQIVLELHDLQDLGNPTIGNRILQSVRNLARSHRCIHIHANNYSRLVRFGNYWFPDCLEVTFMSSRAFKTWVKAMDLHKELDTPCDLRATEIDLESILCL